MRHWLIFFLLPSCLLLADQTTDQGAKAGVNLLDQTSKAFTQVAKRAMPSTVFIKAQGASSPYDEPTDPFEMFFGRRAPQQPSLSSGSGFLISADGYIVTNYHVIRDAQELTATLNDGREFPAKVVGSDPRTDLALLKIEEKNLPFLRFGDSDLLEVGEWIVAIGCPFALESSLTVGVVSAKGRQDLGIASYEDFIQTDASINPGNSGGPLLNLQSEVIGVNTAIASRSGGSMGISFSIPSKIAEHVITQMLNGGTVKRSYLGVVLQPLDKELADAMGQEAQEGLLVSEVIKDSPAAKAGIKQGDLIVEYNGKIAKGLQKFRNDIAMMPPNTQVKLKIIRSKKAIALTATLSLQPDHGAVASDILQKMGLQAENMSPEWAAKLGYSAESSGVVITQVKQGSPAAVAGLRPGFVIAGVAVNWGDQRPVHNIDELEEALASIDQEGGRDQKHWILIVRHHNHQRYYTIKRTP